MRQGGDPSLMAELRPILADIVYFLSVDCLKKMSSEDENRRILTTITQHSSQKIIHGSACYRPVLRVLEPKTKVSKIVANSASATKIKLW